MDVKYSCLYIELARRRLIKGPLRQGLCTCMQAYIRRASVLNNESLFYAYIYITLHNTLYPAVQLPCTLKGTNINRTWQTWRRTIAAVRGVRYT